MTIGRTGTGMPIPVSRAIRVVILTISRAIILGSQSAICGNLIISTITRKPMPRNGIEERNTSPTVTSAGARAFIVQQSSPKGGVTSPSYIENPRKQSR